MIWHSLWALFFIIPLLLVAIFVFYRKNKRQPFLYFSSLSVVKNINPGLRSYFVQIPLVLKVIAIGLAIVALARPQKADTQIKRNVEGIDIVIALDVSDSMLIEDMKPTNRLESSKKTIEDFIKQRISDRIGLVVFSGESYTRVPMTLDYPLLLKSLSDVTTTENIKMGTAIGVALANSVSRLKDSTAKSRIVIFLTDGENNSGTIDPLTAIGIAKDFDVKIYSIGMGKDGETRLPVYVTDAFGRKRKTYRPFYSKVNEELLNKMAEDTGGRYYRANTTNALQEVFDSINKLEKTKIESTQYTKYDELFKSWLLWAMFLYLLAFVFSNTLLRRGP